MTILSAWALLALLAAGERSAVVEAGAGWLYHLHRLVFPLSALGRYLNLHGRGEQR